MSPALAGDHTRAVLTELGLDDDAVAELFNGAVVRQSAAGEPATD
jgi:cyanate lyase